MLYSVVFYIVIGVFVVYTGIVKVQEMRDLKTSDFDATVHGYLFLVYIHVTALNTSHHASGVRQKIPCVPLATEPCISLIILTPIKILQRNLNRSTFVV